jgi:hypothetical protein
MAAVNMLAAAPRTREGRPDLTGIWDKGLLPGEVPPPGPFTAIGPSQAFRDLAAAVPEGLPIQPWAAQLKASRFGQNSYGTLEIEVTVDDLNAFTRPFTFTLQQRLMPDTEVIEFVCGENNRSAAHLVGD